MDKVSFPLLALGMGLFILVSLVGSGAFSAGGEYLLPLLTLLIMSEFGFFVTAIGAGIGLRSLFSLGVKPLMLLLTAGCAVHAAVFLYLGLRLWPGGAPG